MTVYPSKRKPLWEWGGQGGILKMTQISSQSAITKLAAAETATGALERTWKKQLLNKLMNG